MNRFSAWCIRCRVTIGLISVPFSTLTEAVEFARRLQKRGYTAQVGPPSLREKANWLQWEAGENGQVQLSRKKIENFIWKG